MKIIDILKSSLKTVIIVLLSVLLVVSISGNVYQAIKGKIEWNNITHAESTSYSSSISSAMNLTFLNSYYQQTGSKVIWKKYSFKESKDMEGFLNTKDFMFTLFSKIYTIGHNTPATLLRRSEYIVDEWCVIIPEVVPEVTPVKK
jgi:hypothetical protein